MEKKTAHPSGQDMDPPSTDLNSLGEHGFRHLAEALPEIVFTSTAKGEVDYFSARWGDFIGVAEDDPDYLNWALRIHPDDLESVSKTWAAAIEAGVVYEKEFRLRAADGEYHWFSTRVVPVRGSSDQVIKWCGVTTNINVHKELEMELRKVADQKDEFLAMLGHELRNPLAAIRTSFDVVNRPDATSEQKVRATGLLEKQIGHLTRLVDDTLDISRLSSDKFRLITCPVEVNQLTEDCCASYHEEAATAGVSLTAAPSEGEIWVSGDDVRIHQCLTNLLQNAVKFTDPGGSIEIRVSSCEDQAKIEVSDSGIGMTKDEIKRIFEPFEQGLGAQQLSTAGLGLGLAVIGKLIKMHGGKVSCHSDGKGLGSTFIISLPRIDPPGAHEEPEKIQINLGPQSILLIEDNESVAQSLQMFFEIEGHEIHIATSGAEALERLDKETPDILISDLTLPGHLSGWEIAEKVTGSYPEPSRPYLIALSGHTQPHHREKSFEAGFDEHLAKPPTPEQIRQALINASQSLTQRRSK